MTETTKWVVGTLFSGAGVVAIAGLYHWVRSSRAKSTTVPVHGSQPNTIAIGSGTTVSGSSVVMGSNNQQTIVTIVTPFRSDTPSESPSSVKPTETWDVSEITLEAHYFNHAPDTLTIACQSVCKVPGKYEDDIAADGGVQRSEIEPPCLLVKGVDLKSLDAIKWEPNSLFFKDVATGELKEFPVLRWGCRELKAAKFAIHG